MDIKSIGASIVVITAVAFAWYVILKPSEPTQTEGRPMVEVSLPELGGAAALGEPLFVANCSICHGLNAAGKEGLAPPLVHRIYRPGHHADIAFELAAQIGVRSHHWPFGSMPPVEGVSKSDVKMITAYVRALQRENGIN